MYCHFVSKHAIDRVPIYPRGMEFVEWFKLVPYHSQNLSACSLKPDLTLKCDPHKHGLSCESPPIKPCICCRTGYRILKTTDFVTRRDCVTCEERESLEMLEDWLA